VFRFSVQRLSETPPIPREPSEVWYKCVLVFI